MASAHKVILDDRELLAAFQAELPQFRLYLLEMPKNLSCGRSAMFTLSKNTKGVTRSPVPAQTTLGDVG
eukprot:2169967-Amphidinium_carterae.1